MIFRIKRNPVSLKAAFPFVKTFIYVGGRHGHYCCDLCYDGICKIVDIPLIRWVPTNIEYPTICSKCGMDY
jgi:hypothetical protein